MKTNIITIILSSSILWLSGCNSTNNEKNIEDIETAQATEVSGDAEATLNDIGIAKIYIKGKTDTSIVAETKIQDESGIEKITLYCIDAEKYYKEGKVVVVEQTTKKYISSETKFKFFQYTFKNLVPETSYMLKVVAKTEAGDLSQQITTVTAVSPKTTRRPKASVAPVIYIQETVSLGSFTSYHTTLNEYILNLTTAIKVSTVQLEEYDGDLGLFDIFVKDTSGTEIAIGENVISSGNSIAKIHTFTNPNTSILVESIIIRPSNGLGGAWRLDSLIVNP